MTNERASATNEAQPLKPVTMQENKDAKGHALCAEMFWRRHIESTQELRDRQAAYLDSLPRNPTDAIRAALRIMSPDGKRYPDGFENGLHLSQALEVLLTHGEVDDGCMHRDAALYIAEEIVISMHQATRELDRMKDLLRNPGRIERDAKHGT